jgi:hypothetical protein
VVLSVFSVCLALGVVLGIKALSRAGRKVDASAAQFEKNLGREGAGSAGIAPSPGLPDAAIQPAPASEPRSPLGR